MAYYLFDTCKRFLSAAGGSQVLQVLSPSRQITCSPTTMNKFERIRLLKHLGLNTETSVLIEKEEDMGRHAEFLDALPEYSVRTFYRAYERFGEPHFPVVDRARLEAECLPLLEEGYALIVGEPIDPAEAQMAGCIIDQGNSFLVEVALGPGTVRRVTHGGRVDRRWELVGSRDPHCDPVIQTAIRELEGARRHWSEQIDLSDTLYEFSVYSLAVGWRRQATIFWEIRGLGMRDADLERFYRRAMAL